MDNEKYQNLKKKLRYNTNYIKHPFFYLVYYLSNYEKMYLSYKFIYS
jgi:hypothetical protein